MLAKNNSDIEDTIVTLHELSDDEKIKLQCEARERHEWDMASAIAKGKREGEERLLQLINLLTEENKTNLIPKITADSQYREELYQKYGL